MKMDSTLTFTQSREFGYINDKTSHLVRNITYFLRAKSLFAIHVFDPISEWNASGKQVLRGKFNQAGEGCFSFPLEEIESSSPPRLFKAQIIRPPLQNFNIAEKETRRVYTRVINDINKYTQRGRQGEEREGERRGSGGPIRRRGKLGRLRYLWKLKPLPDKYWRGTTYETPKFNLEFD